jgi:hypothetical protein
MSSLSIAWLLIVCSVANAADVADGARAVNSSFNATDLWGRVVSLLNERNGTVTKEHLEKALGVQLHTAVTDPDATVYRLFETKVVPFTVTLIVYNEQFRSRAPAENGPHINWSVDWPAPSGGDNDKTNCITAARARADLLGSGWSSPWSSWGAAESHPPPQSSSFHIGEPGDLGNPGPPVLAPFFNFFRQSDEATGHRDRLPRGRLFSTGDLADSCVTGITMTAAL